MIMIIMMTTRGATKIKNSALKPKSVKAVLWSQGKFHTGRRFVWVHWWGGDERICDAMVCTKHQRKAPSPVQITKHQCKAPSPVQSPAGGEILMHSPPTVYVCVAENELHTRIRPPPCKNGSEFSFNEHTCWSKGQQWRNSKLMGDSEKVVHFQLEWHI